jgi:predicted TPR repeat methyltransferase
MAPADYVQKLFDAYAPRFDAISSTSSATPCPN